MIIKKRKLLTILCDILLELQISVFV